MNEERLKRSCPVCGAHKPKLMWRQRFQDGPMGDGYDVVVCRECGAGYADGIPSQADMEHHYSEDTAV